MSFASKKNFARYGAASIAACLLLATTSAQAQAPADEPDANAPALDSIVVTGQNETNGLNLTARETPQSVTSLDSLRMQEQGLTDISEVMQQIVGIQTNRSSALGTDGTNYTARGFAVQNYLVDGVARPSNIYGFTEDTADMIAYDRIEVIRGSAGMMTGTGEPSAAINMIRKRPRRRPEHHGRGDHRLLGQIPAGRRYRRRADRQRPYPRPRRRRLAG
ncbi:TonB-dependent receptor plug domain-containing protein [Sphingobium yanoikuyae]|uniref:TonB-dependent receptor plug domain-containing protein n=1 Tax=Sphingobium yanoikuyae TaxID=13690 RepID=UPI0031D623BF